MKFVEVESKKEEIYNKYYNEKKSYREIAREIGCKSHQIAYLFNKNNWKPRSLSESKRIYNVNDNYFNQIDTPNKAYILGFLYADGYNSSSTRGMIIRIKDIDVDILYKIKNEINSEAPITPVDDELEYKGKKVKRHHMNLSVYNKQIHEDLEKWGVYSYDKTFRITFPFWLSNDLKWHFIRGYFDGDGCFYEYKNKDRALVTIMSSAKFSDELCDFLNDNEIKCTSTFASNASEKNKIVKFSSKKAVKRFFDFIYKDAEIYLDRKYNKVKKYYELHPFN